MGDNKDTRSCPHKRMQHVMENKEDYANPIYFCPSIHAWFY